MKIKFIGTGSGKTSLKRYHSSFVIESGKNILFDCGDSTSRALLASGYSFNDIDAIVFSHHHADHFAGIASLITQMKLIKREKELSIFTHSSLAGHLISFIESTYMFLEILDFDLNITHFEKDIPFATGDVEWIPRKNSHIQNKHNVDTNIPFNSFSFLVKSEGKNLFISSDIGSKKDLNLFGEFQIHSAILESTHISVKEIIEFCESTSPEKCILTHIDDEMEEDIISDIEKNSRTSTTLIMANDGLLIEI